MRGFQLKQLLVIGLGAEFLGAIEVAQRIGALVGTSKTLILTPISNPGGHMGKRLGQSLGGTAEGIEQLTEGGLDLDAVVARIDKEKDAFETIVVIGEESFCDDLVGNIFLNLLKTPRPNSASGDGPIVHIDTEKMMLQRV